MPAAFWQRADIADALQRRDLGTVLRAWRRVTGRSQFEAAALVGYDPLMIRMIESGDARYGTDTVLDVVLALRTGGAVTSTDAADEGDDMDRRELLRYVAGAAVAVGVDARALGDTLRPDAAPTRDARMLDGHREVLAQAVDGYAQVRPDTLAPIAHLVLSRAADALSGARGDSERLAAAIVADAATLAGWLTYDLGNLADARGHFAHAQHVASEHGDEVRHALATAALGVSYSPAPDGGHGAPRRALQLLEAADGALERAASEHPARTWIASMSASKAARAGDSTATWQWIDGAAARADETSTRIEAAAGMWSWRPAGDRVRAWVDVGRGSALSFLADPAAEGELRAAVAAAEPFKAVEGRRALMDLLVRWARYDEAAGQGLQALESAGALGLRREYRRLAGTRNLAPDGERAFAAFDEALAAAT